MEHEGEVLGRRNLLLEMGRVGDEVAVVEALDDLALEKVLHVLEIDDHPRHRVGLPAQRHFEPVVVAVWARARAEQAHVLARRKLGADVAQGAREFDGPREAYQNATPRN